LLLISSTSLDCFNLTKMAREKRQSTSKVKYTEDEADYASGSEFDEEELEERSEVGRGNDGEDSEDADDAWEGE
jgi:hypothetical protein